MKKILLVLLCGSLVFIGGCWDQFIVDELALAFALGVDDDGEDPELFTLSMTNPTFSKTAAENTKKIASQGYSLPSAFFNMQKQRDRLLVLGQVDVMIFSEGAANSGLMHRVMQEVDQQRDLNPNVKLAIVRGAKAQDVIYLEPPEEARIAVFLDHLFDRNFNSGGTPRITASRYWFRYSTVGIDPVIPVIEITGHEDEKTSVVIVGLAAFDSEGKMKGTLTDAESVHFLNLTGQTRRGRFSTKLDIDGQLRDASGYIKGVKRWISTDIVDDIVRIAIRMEIDIDINNIDWSTDALDEDVGIILETALARDIQGNALAMIKKTQSWGSDIVGLGQHVRIQNSKWFRGRDWSEDYRQSHITMEVKVNIQRIGTLVNPQY